MEHLWSILNTRDAVKDLEYLLTITPLLERALGDILFTIKLKIAGKNNNTCDKTSVMIPSLMRDLIVSAELEELMGLPFIRELIPKKYFIELFYSFFYLMHILLLKCL